MSRRLKQAAVLVVVLVAAAQFVRPGRANPPTEYSRTIQAHAGTDSGLVAVLDRSCAECHSNATTWQWPWYGQIAPVSWLLADGVKKGRDAVNFSEWGSYSPSQQKALLAASCEDAKAGKMPGLYTLVRADAKLSAMDIDTICRSTP